MKMPFAAKAISLGVIGKAILMGTLVSVLAVTSFTQSIILVLVSACATGVFGLIIVLIQTHAEKEMHRRLDGLERKTKSIDRKADTITTAVMESDS